VARMTGLPAKSAIPERAIPNAKTPVMVRVQDWIPILNQVAFLREARELSGWCRVGHHIDSTRSLRVVEPFMVGNAIF
jgi:hypothetical protein